MKIVTHWLPALCLAFLTGCGLDGPIPRGAKHDEPAAAQAPAANTASQPAADKKPHENVAGGLPSSPPKPTAAKPGTIREKAAAGMGEKGRGYGGDMITVAPRAEWNVKERLVLDQIQLAMDLYKAENGGNPPKTQEEYMAKIIQAQNIKLPTLPPGQRYVYDPHSGELMVEKPNNL